MEKMLLKILQNSQENPCARGTLLKKSLKVPIIKKTNNKIDQLTVPIINCIKISVFHQALFRLNLKFLTSQSTKSKT